MIDPDHAILLLEDDPDVRQELECLLKSKGYKVRTLSEPGEMLSGNSPAVPSCLLLDQKFSKGMSGLHFHSELRSRGWEVSTILLAAEWNVRSVVDSMRAGADGFLTKPVNPAELWDSVSYALSKAKENHHKNRMAAEDRARIESLTPRECEILTLVVAGLLNKQIADQLGLALVTVKVHRARIMHKLKAGNPAELVRIASVAGLVPNGHPGFRQSPAGNDLVARLAS